MPVRAGRSPVRIVEWPRHVSVVAWLWWPLRNTAPEASRARPPVNCGRYSSNRSAENWSTEMTTRSLGGGGSWAPAGTARRAATAARISLRITLRSAVELRPQPFVDELGVSLAGHRLHRL